MTITDDQSLLQSPKFAVFSGSERLDLGPKHASVICESEAQARHMITLWPGTGYYEPMQSDAPPAVPTGTPELRITSHFNQLSEAEHERLSLLIEECSEVIQAATKILRHGYASNNNGQLQEANRQAIERELGHVQNAYRLMLLAGDVDPNKVAVHADSKARRIAPFLHHQAPPATNHPIPE